MEKADEVENDPVDEAYYTLADLRGLSTAMLACGERIEGRDDRLNRDKDFEAVMSIARRLHAGLDEAVDRVSGVVKAA